MPDFQNQIQDIFTKACNCLKVTGFHFRVMNRTAPVNNPRSFRIAYTNLKTKLVAIDILTPRKREPKSIASILRTLAHEIAHHQKKPFKQLYRGHVITRSHYPQFYKQVNKNIGKLKSDPVLSQYFV
jgi:hypothetical protein